MRDIKFRAWDRILKKMTYGVFMKLREFEYINILGMFTILNQRYDLMQYTGLYDKSGKEIYEGDILIDEHNEEYCEVIFECGKFVCNFETNSIDLSDISDELIDIGNIYENKELIGDN